jgi:hypothetical protein
VLIAQFQSGTVASRYFSSIVLERLCHSESAVDCLLGEDLEQIGIYVWRNRAMDAEDARPGARSSLLLSSVLLHVWRRVAAVNHPQRSALFANTVTALAVVLDVHTTPDAQSYARIAQGMFLEILAIIASFDDLVLAVENDDLISTVVGLAAAEDSTGKEAQKALFALSRVDPRQAS